MKVGFLKYQIRNDLRINELRRIQAVETAISEGLSVISLGGHKTGMDIEQMRSAARHPRFLDFHDTPDEILDAERRRQWHIKGVELKFDKELSKMEPHRIIAIRDIIKPFRLDILDLYPIAQEVNKIEEQNALLSET